MTNTEEIRRRSRAADPSLARNTPQPRRGIARRMTLRRQR
jgi:hypothetical protein